jgi:hypothetical protein
MLTTPAFIMAKTSAQIDPGMHQQGQAAALRHTSPLKTMQSSRPNRPTRNVNCGANSGRDPAARLCDATISESAPLR